MKKVLLLAAAALLGLSACQNVETEQAPVGDEFVITLNAAIAPSAGPATRTVYVPENGKVNWLKGDKINARFPAASEQRELIAVQTGGTHEVHRPAAQKLTARERRAEGCTVGRGGIQAASPALIRGADRDAHARRRSG